MNISKTVISSILFLSLFLSFTLANRINILDTLWRDFDINTKTIDSKLENLQDKYGLNIDIAVLGEDDKSCYTDPYFYTCIQREYNYTSDILINIKKKLSSNDRGDINTLREDKFSFFIDTYTLNEAQDKAIPYFKKEDLNNGILTYLTELDSKLAISCDNIYNNYISLYKQITDNKKTILKKSCNVFDLKKIYNSSLTLTKEISYQKKKEATKRMIIYIILGILIIFGLYFGYIKFQTSRYTHKLKSMLKDIKFYKIELEDKNSFFPDAKKELNDDILFLEDRLERYIGDMDKNRKLLKKQYNLFSIEKEKISKLRKKSIYDYTHQDELKEKIEEFKKRDL